MAISIFGLKKMAAFDLVNVNDGSPLVKQFKIALAKASGQQVISFIPHKMKKVSGESTKDLVFALENGQTVTLVVRTDGDVIRVKINGKDTPIKSDLFHFAADGFTAINPGKMPNYGVAANTADKNSVAGVFSKAVNEIAERVRAGQPAFDKRKEQEKVTITRTAAAKNTSTPAKTKELKESISQLDTSLVAKTAQRDALKQRIEARQVQVAAAAGEA
jgi:hypothetical protein